MPTPTESEAYAECPLLGFTVLFNGKPVGEMWEMINGGVCLEINSTLPGGYLALREIRLQIGERISTTPIERVMMA
jgi:hypothetical protein